MSTMKLSRLLAGGTILAVSLIGLTGCGGGAATDQSAPDKAVLSFYQNLRDNHLQAAYDTLYAAVDDPENADKITAAVKLHDSAATSLKYGDIKILNMQQGEGSARVKARSTVNGETYNWSVDLTKGGPDGDKWYLDDTDWKSGFATTGFNSLHPKVLIDGKPTAYRDQILLPGVYKFQITDNAKLYKNRIVTTKVGVGGSVDGKASPFVAAGDLTGVYTGVVRETLDYCAKNNIVAVQSQAEAGAAIGNEQACPSWNDPDGVAANAAKDNVFSFFKTTYNTVFDEHAAFKPITEPSIKNIAVDGESGDITVNLTGGSFQTFTAARAGDGYTYQWGPTETYDGHSLTYGYGADTDPLAADNAIYDVAASS